MYVLPNGRPMTTNRLVPRRHLKPRHRIYQRSCVTRYPYSSSRGAQTGYLALTLTFLRRESPQIEVRYETGALRFPSVPSSSFFFGRAVAVVRLLKADDPRIGGADLSSVWRGDACKARMFHFLARPRTDSRRPGIDDERVYSVVAQMYVPYGCTTIYSYSYS